MILGPACVALGVDVAAVAGGRVAGGVGIIFDGGGGAVELDVRRVAGGIGIGIEVGGRGAPDAEGLAFGTRSAGKLIGGC